LLWFFQWGHALETHGVVVAVAIVHDNRGGASWAGITVNLQ